VFGKLAMSTGFNGPADQPAKGLEANPEAERELRQLVDAVPQHVVVLAADGLRLYANQVALDYHGLTLREFLAEVTLAQFVHPEDLEIPQAAPNRNKERSAMGSGNSSAQKRRAVSLVSNSRQSTSR